MQPDCSRFQETGLNGVGEKFIATGYLPHIPESGKPFRALGG
jgi:hypothetical protein